MRGFHRDRWEPEARVENVRVQHEVKNGPIWPYERQNWEQWKQLGQPKDMMIVLGDGTIFWSKGQQTKARHELTPFHVVKDGWTYAGWGTPSLEPYG